MFPLCYFVSYWKFYWKWLVIVFFFNCLQVTNSDPLPHVICIRCAEQLDALYGFKETARKAEDILHQFLAYTRQLLGSSQVSKIAFIYSLTKYWERKKYALEETKLYLFAYSKFFDTHKNLDTVQIEQQIRATLDLEWPFLFFCCFFCCWIRCERFGAGYRQYCWRRDSLIVDGVLSTCSNLIGLR